MSITLTKDGVNYEFKSWADACKQNGSQSAKSQSNAKKFLGGLGYSHPEIDVIIPSAPRGTRKASEITIDQAVQVFIKQAVKIDNETIIALNNELTNTTQMLLDAKKSDSALQRIMEIANETKTINERIANGKYGADELTEIFKRAYIDYIAKQTATA